MSRWLSLIPGRVLAILSEKPATLGIRVFATFEIIMIVATHPLWTGRTDFPAVPLVPMPPVPVWISGILTAALLMACLLLASLQEASTSRLSLHRAAAMAALAAGGLLVILDQHRLQAWHWLFILNLLWYLLFLRSQRLSLMRQTLCTVYVCSALSRLTPAPAAGIVGLVARQLITTLHLPDWNIDAPSFTVLCHVLTAGELLTGLLLLHPRTQKTGCIAGTVLHLMLLVALGPFGLNHHSGVLLWNVCFLCVLPLLFLSKSCPAADAPQSLPWKRFAVIAVWLFPLSGLLGFGDNWPSWQLYSNRPETWILYVHQADARQLNSALSVFMGQPTPLSDLVPIKLDRWSLERTRSPMYPEDRFQLAVIEDVLRQLPDDCRFLIDISSPSFPFWWQRTSRQITTPAQLELEHRTFLLGSTPESHPER